MTKHITLGVTGCIGAYKAILVLRGLQQLGATVEVVMTEAATRFIQPLTFQALSGKPVYTSHWGRDDDTDIAHIALAQRTHALVIAPATANSLARLAHGIADDFVNGLSGGDLSDLCGPGDECGDVAAPGYAGKPGPVAGAWRPHP